MDIGSHLTCSRHVAKTGDIKDFVITEESGIAKGIRRLVAVTGQEAQVATRAAEVLKSKLEALENTDGKDKDAGLKALNLVSPCSQSVGVLGSPFLTGAWTSGHLCHQESGTQGSVEFYSEDVR